MGAKYIFLYYLVNRVPYNPKIHYRIHKSPLFFFPDDPTQNLDMIYSLTANGLTPSGSSTVHIYTQTIHRTTK